MALLEEVDKPQSDIEIYVKRLDTILLRKMEMIGSIRQKLVRFHSHLEEEHSLQTLY
jgi:kinesin family protein 2/24